MSRPDDLDCVRGFLSAVLFASTFWTWIVVLMLRAAR